MEVVARWLTASETAPLPAPFQDGFSSARGAIACVRAGYHRQIGDVAAAMVAARDVLNMKATASRWRGIGHAVVGLTYAAHGEWEPARTSVETWVEVGRRAGPGGTARSRGSPTRRRQREIGRELYLFLNTVKSGTRSIFRKLGVSGREQAVARARELGLT